MAILASDIQLLESERMRDTSDGGGRQTGEVIVSGEVGNIFPKISRLDSVYGRVNLRKIYLSVRTANNDVYAGAHAIVSAPPANDRVGCLLFSTESAFDTRDQARDRIESYVVAGPLSRMRLYGNQLIGQQAILTYQAESEPLPDVGQVFVLSTENSAGVASAQQYVRITDVTHEMRTFTDAQGDFTRRVITLKIGSRLEQTFSAGEVVRLSTDSSATKLRVTQVADASQYYGIQPITEAADIGDLSLRLASVYAPLVPSTNRETGVSLVEIGGANISQFTSPNPITIRIVLPTTGATEIRFPGPVKRIAGGAVKIQQVGGFSSKVKDDGLGNLGRDGSSQYWWSGNLNYETGVATITSVNLGGNPMQAGNYDLIYYHDVSDAGPAHTHQVPVTLSTRGSVYAETLNPLPAPGTVIVDFRALGRWYRLRDDGAGVLVANDPSDGSGSVDYVTGAVIVTLGALPDVDSAVLFAWGSPAHYEILATSTDKVAHEWTVANAPIKPDTLTITWAEGGVAKTASDDGLGVISGHAAGVVDYAQGVVRMEFTKTPDGAVDSAYEQRDAPATEAVSANTHTAPGAILPRSVLVFMNINYPDGTTDAAFVSDDGLGNIRYSLMVPGPLQIGSVYQYQLAAGTVIIGSVNYASGVITLNGTMPISKNTWVDGPTVWTWQLQSAGNATLAGSSYQYNLAAGASSTNRTYVVPPASALNVTLGKAEPMYIVPGSVMFTAAGKTYIDRNGTLYADVSPTTGAGISAGTINYETGAIDLTYYTPNVALNLNILACLGRYGEWTMTEAAFRTAGSPLRPASFYVQATAADGTLMTGTSDQNGEITGTWITGTVQQDMGVVALEFGKPAMPSTLRYSCVVITNLPLDPDILGLDPVRLPSDGRVPIYRPADIAVIHHTDTLDLVNPVVAGSTYSAGRTGLYSLTVADATGAAVSDALYSVDLAAGTVTIDPAWTGSGITQPLTVTHRVEDMVLLSDVQINGQIEFASPLAHAYPVGAYVSSALPFGDLQAIVTNVFDQQTWTSVWSDSLIGTQATAQFDIINYPISCLNESAVTERWRINFTSTTAFQVIGENLGVIATGTTSTATTPINPVTGDPYFSIPAAGWGSGWATGNQLRFNTLGASGPTWIARTILAGASLAGDQFGFEGRGDVD